MFSKLKMAVNTTELKVFTNCFYTKEKTLHIISTQITMIYEGEVPDALVRDINKFVEDRDLKLSLELMKRPSPPSHTPLHPPAPSQSPTQLPPLAQLPQPPVRLLSQPPKVPPQQPTGIQR